MGRPFLEEEKKKIRLRIVKRKNPGHPKPRTTM